MQRDVCRPHPCSICKPYATEEYWDNCDKLGQLGCPIEDKPCHEECKEERDQVDKQEKYGDSWRAAFHTYRKCMGFTRRGG